MGAATRSCWVCGDTVTVQQLRWGRDHTVTPWFTHTTTGTPLCQKEEQS